MPSYLIEAMGYTTFTTTVEADSPKEALNKAKELHDDDWTIERDAEPGRGPISYITELSEDQREFEVSDDGELNEMSYIPTAPGESLIKTVDAARASGPNKEGLTLKEWMIAADIWVDNGDENWEPLHIGSAYEAWKAGEDPTEWRAESSNGEKL